jgi:hypothetical protein
MLHSPSLANLHSSPCPAGTALQEREDGEFGGTAGVVYIMLFSHLVPYYLWICWRFHDGAVTYPNGWSDISSWLGHMVTPGAMQDHRHKERDIKVRQEMVETAN